jgi:REP element-mobilizing transposase RayT
MRCRKDYDGYMVAVTGISSPAAATAGSSSFGSAKRRDLFLKILEEVRAKYDFGIAGYVVMPEHFHLLMTEPKQRTLPLVMQVLKHRVSRACRKKKRESKQLGIW